MLALKEGGESSSHKRTATNLERRIRMTCKYAGGQSLSAIACELGSVLSAVNMLLA
jgi:hypothetical protein